MHIAVVTSSPPNVEGGHLVIARALVDALTRSGHQPHLVVTPDYGFGRLTASYRAARATNVTELDGAHIDRVISFRYPSFAVRHPRHVCWLNHTMREYYDLWPRFAASISWRNRIKEGVRKAVLHTADAWLLRHNVTRVVAQSKTIQQRVASDFGIDADIVYPPAPLTGYRCDEYGDFVFSVSRLDPLKRVDLLVRALAEPAGRATRAVIAGEGECGAELRSLAQSLGVADRVQFVGRIDDARLIGFLATCRAVCFTPLAEDYGFVTIEAFASGKPVITCADSGGPAELVSQNQNGLVCDATPAAIAAAIARLTADRHEAERLGSQAAAFAATLTWDETVRRLCSTAR
ncbi:MAG TPA: glycosyltransferase family 4 protein [Vicinamibacterales bacterium]|nr:glycosyltransferase family 4 protein [Vicinamibacterales bacterium]